MEGFNMSKRIFIGSAGSPSSLETAKKNG